MVVTYLHHYYLAYFAPVRVVAYLVIIAVFVAAGAVARRSGRGDTGSYGGSSAQGRTPTPDSPYSAWSDQPPQGQGRR
jgi:hypothetical protein